MWLEVVGHQQTVNSSQGHFVVDGKKKGILNLLTSMDQAPVDSVPPPKRKWGQKVTSQWVSPEGDIQIPLRTTGVQPSKNMTVLKGPGSRAYDLLVLGTAVTKVHSRKGPTAPTTFKRPPTKIFFFLPLRSLSISSTAGSSQARDESGA